MTSASSGNDGACAWHGAAGVHHVLLSAARKSTQRIIVCFPSEGVKLDEVRGVGGLDGRDLRAVQFTPFAPQGGAFDGAKGEAYVFLPSISLSSASISLSNCFVGGGPTHRLRIMPLASIR